MGGENDSWRVGTLGELAEVEMGTSPKGETCNEIGNGIPLLNGPTEFGGHHPIPVQFTSAPVKRCNPGDVLFCVRGSTTGRMNWADQEYAIGRGLAAIRHINNPELQQLVRAIIDWRLPQLLAVATGSTFPSVSKSDIQAIECFIPPLPEQKTIAGILGALDDKIELNRRMNETLESMARAIFKSWFVDFDPVRAKMDGQQPPGMNPETAALFPDSFEEQDGEMLPKGWEVKPVSSIIKVIGGGTPKKSEAAYWDGNIPWFSVRDAPAESDVFVIDTDLKITERGLKESSTKLLPEGTTIISARGTVGKLAMVASEMTMNQSCYGIFPNEESGVCFNFFVLKHVVDQLKQNAHGAVFDTITTSTFDTVEITQSNREIVRSFEGEAEPLLERIKSNVCQSQTLANLRDTLLPKLLSGELRVPEAEKQVEEVV